MPCTVIPGGYPTDPVSEELVLENYPEHFSLVLVFTPLSQGKWLTFHGDYCQGTFSLDSASYQQPPDLFFNLIKPTPPCATEMSITLTLDYIFAFHNMKPSSYKELSRLVKGFENLVCHKNFSLQRRYVSASMKFHVCAIQLFVRHMLKLHLQPSQCKWWKCTVSYSSFISSLLLSRQSG